MQDAFSQDMFNISDLNNPRYNGHVQSSCGLKATGGGSGGLSMGLSGGALVSGGKKDRKGCTKGKIEAIMRNNTVRTKVVMPLNVSSALSTAAVKKSASSSSNTANHLQNQQQSVLFIPNHQVSTSSLHSGGRHDVIRVKEDHDDPYTFTESEPQVLGIYQAGGSTASSKAKSSTVSSSGAAVVQHHRSTNTLVSGERNRTVDRTTGLKHIKSHQHNAASNISSGVAIHDHIKTGKMMQTVQELANRSPRTVPKRKVPSAATVRANTGANSSFHNQGHYQEGSSKSSHHHHGYQRRSQQTCSDRVCLQAKQQPRKSVWQRERNAKHELLERIHGVQSKLAAYNRDLYPLGVEVSDSESDEFELEKRAVYERHWFSRSDADLRLAGGDPWNKRGSTSVSDNVADESESPRERRVECARSETRRRLAQTLAGIKSAGEPSASLVKAVVRAARVVPNATALLLALKGSQTLPSPNKTIRGARFLTTGEKCSYYEGCNNQALPATRHCLRHIMYNVDQRLFSHCTGRLEDNTQCNRPTFDPAHVSPLCPLHTSQAQATVVRSSSDSRHSRKKSRMLGMSRNSKRNNKKKKKSSLALSSSSLETHNNNNSSHHHHHHHHHHGGGHHSTSTSSSSSSNQNSNRHISSSTSTTIPSSYSTSTNNHINYQLHQPLNQQLVQQKQSAVVVKHDHQEHTDNRNAVISRLQQHSVGTETAASSSPVPSLSATSTNRSSSTSQVNHHLNTNVVPNVAVENIVGPTADILIDPTLQHRPHTDIVEEVSEEVLAIEALDPVELANQTTRLLEEQDLNNVLNQISTDLAFNDLFIDKNGEYEPTREETEELERALEAVDNDVRSLERMSRALPIPLPLLQLPLEGLLDTATGSTAGPSSPTGATASANFDSTSVDSPTTVTVDTFQNGYVGSPVLVNNTVTSSNLVSDTLHQPT